MDFAAALETAKAEPFYHPAMELDAVDRGASCFVFSFFMPESPLEGGWAVVHDSGDVDFTQEPPAELAGAKRVWGEADPIRWP